VKTKKTQGKQKSSLNDGEPDYGGQVNKKVEIFESKRPKEWNLIETKMMDGTDKEIISELEDMSDYGLLAIKHFGENDVIRINNDRKYIRWKNDETRRLEWVRVNGDVFLGEYHEREEE
jgi:hypothetical protein